LVLVPYKNHRTVSAGSGHAKNALTSEPVKFDMAKHMGCVYQSVYL